MKYAKITIVTAFIPLIIFLGNSCAPQKSRDGSFIAKSYHNMTARYNGYFNANYKLNQVYKGVASSHSDDFSQEVIDLYVHNDKEETSTYSSDLQTVIKKCSKVIKMHKYSRWADNCYFLVGQSHYLKGNYESARKTFQYISTNYDIKQKEIDRKKARRLAKKRNRQEEKARKKARRQSKREGNFFYELFRKDEEKKDTVREEGDEVSVQKEAEKKKQIAKKRRATFHFLRHHPSYYSAMVWLVKSFVKKEKYSDAQSVLTILKSEENFPYRLREKLHKAQAFYYIEKEDYQEAIRPIRLTIEYTKKRKDKARLYYILAQLYENTGSLSLAFRNFQKVLNQNPPYEMAFNAKMSMAELSGKDPRLATGDLEKQLKEMLKDDKNIDYFDQIYYALAELALKNDHEQKALAYLNKSIRSSKSNNKQKAKSYLKIADIHFQNNDYAQAQPYYDSTLTAMTQKHQRYAKIQNRNQVLQKVVKQKEIIQKQDSLLRIASMSNQEREQFVENLIQKRKRKRRQQKKNKNEEVSDIGTEQDQEDGLEAGPEGGKWYFYNQSAKSSGYNAFVQKWGKRKLKDHWRRSVKKQGISAPEQEASSSDKLADQGEDSGLNKKELLAQLPGSDKARQRANRKMINAYYKLGTLYKNKLDNRQKALTTFEELDSKFEGYDLEPKVLYQLYLLYGKNGNASKKKEYRQKILSKYPASKFAKIIRDPDYFKKQKEKQQRIQNYYENSFAIYKQQKYDSTITRCNQADSLFTLDTLAPRFRLLEAYAQGRSGDITSYEKTLKQFTRDYPDHSLRDHAEDLLWYVREYNKSKVEIDTQKQPKTRYALDTAKKQKDSLTIQFDYKPGKEHYFIISYQSDTINVNNLINQISNFNNDNYSLKPLKVKSLISNNSANIIVVRSFKNKEDAMKYYNLFMGKEDVFKNTGKESLHISVIYRKNLTKLIQKGGTDQYQQFFVSQYPAQK